MFSAKVIGIAFCLMIVFGPLLLSLFERLKFVTGQKLALIAIVVSSIVCCGAGLELVGAWGNTLAGIDEGEMAVAAAKHRRGGTLMLLLHFWPFVLMD